MLKDKVYQRCTDNGIDYQYQPIKAGKSPQAYRTTT